MQSDQYLKERVNDQIAWYNTNSSNNKFYYVTTKVVLTISAAIIPALTAYMDNNTAVKISIGVLSVLMAILANINGIFRFKENWVQYRIICESLQIEKQLYLADAGKYKNSKDKDSLFVEIIEGLLQNGNRQWQETLNSIKETENK